MSHSQFIEVGIGLVFIYLLMAIMVSSANEVIMSLRARRGKFLKEAISLAINDPQNKNWAQLLYDHPLIDNLKRSEKRPPAYISSKTFAMALVEVITSEAREDEYRVSGDTITYIEKDLKLSPIEKFVRGLNTLKESHTKNLLRSFVNNSNGNFDALKLEIENWFNEYMDRVGGWYKRKARRSIFILSLVLTLVMNVDTIDLSIQLWNNSTLRESVTNAAETYAEEHKAEYILEHNAQHRKDSIAVSNILADTSLTQKQKIEAVNKINQRPDEETIAQRMDKIKAAYEQVNLLKLPIGWSDYAGVVSGYKQLLANRIESINNDKTINWFTKWRYRWGARFRHVGNLLSVYSSNISFFTLLGWLFTAIAVSLGAPYWFDLLNRLINMRNAGKAAPKTAQVVIQDNTK